MASAGSTDISFKPAEVGDGQVSFVMELSDSDGYRDIECRVAAATLQNAMGEAPDGDFDDEDILDLYDILAERLHALVRRKFEAGDLEDDGSIAVGPNELTDRRKTTR